MKTAEEDYIPFGPEWEKNLMTTNKKFLIDMIRRNSQRANEAEAQLAQFRSLPIERHIQQLELRIDSLQDQLKSGSDAYQKLKDDNRNLRSVMIAAAEEIKGHWNAHCDKDGYGPSNLLHRLEQGIPAKYNYTSGAFAKQDEQIKEQEQEVERLKEDYERMKEKAFEYLSNVKELEAQLKDKQWISVNDRLPDRGARFLVLIDGSLIDVAFYFENWFYKQVDKKLNVTHWRQLPEALESSPEQPEQKPESFWSEFKRYIDENNQNRNEK